MNNSNLRPLITVLVIAASVSLPAAANDDGTWHGGDGVNSSSTASLLCAVVGAVAGSASEQSCMSLLTE